MPKRLIVLLIALPIGSLITLFTLWYLQQFGETDSDWAINGILLLGIAYGSLVVANNIVNRWESGRS